MSTRRRDGRARPARPRAGLLQRPPVPHLLLLTGSLAAAYAVQRIAAPAINLGEAWGYTVMTAFLSLCPATIYGLWTGSATLDHVRPVGEFYADWLGRVLARAIIPIIVTFLACWVFITLALLGAQEDAMTDSPVTAGVACLLFAWLASSGALGRPRSLLPRELRPTKDHR